MGANDCCCGRFNAAGGSKIIAMVSIGISAIFAVLVIWQYVKLLRAEEQLIAFLGYAVYELRFSEHFYMQKNVAVAMLVVAVICILVAVALIFAVKKRNPMLALPFMIWTILCQIAAGIFIATLIFMLVSSMSSDKSSDSSEFNKLVAVLVFIVVIFVLNTWWLIVVFAFRRLLKSGHAFDSIPMQAA